MTVIMTGQFQNKPAKHRKKAWIQVVQDVDPDHDKAVEVYRFGGRKSFVENKPYEPAKRRGR